MSKYPEAYSDVQVTFIDGEIRTYRISAGPGIGGYLAREAGSSGVLSLFNSKTGQSWAVPVGSIREWCVTQVVTQAVEPIEKPHVSAREAVRRFMYDNPNATWKPQEIVEHVEGQCPLIDMASGVYSALNALRRDGLIEKIGKRWALASRGMNHGE